MNVTNNQTNRSSLTKLLAGLGLSLAMVPVSAGAAPLTYCQENGHGAGGCSDVFSDVGYCWKSSTSTTGYVCREDEPPSENSVEVSDAEIASFDPVYVLSSDGNDPGDDIDALEIVICGPDDGAGCFTWAMPDVCCDQIGLPAGEGLPVGGATITCYD